MFRNGLFKFRNVVGVALVLGIAAGVWMGDLFKGFGTGGDGVGIGRSGTTGLSADAAPEQAVDLGVSGAAHRQPYRVVIKDRSYFLREGAADTPVTLEKLVELVTASPGDEDGVRVRVYQTESARVTAGVRLRDALKAADVPESAAYWSPDAVE